VLEETFRVSGGDRIERLAHDLHQRLPAPGPRLTKRRPLAFQKASSMGPRSGEEYGGW
jgi:hypothetical protein